MSLAPEMNIQRVLISSTSRFVGSYETDDLMITHAFPNFGSRTDHMRILEGPVSRSAYVVSFFGDIPAPRPGVALPNYEGIGDFICSMLCVLYGKRFDSHGCIQTIGQFSLPNLSQFSEITNPNLPHNSHQPRNDFDVSNNLSSVNILKPILKETFDDPEHAAGFVTAARLYQRSLQASEIDVEIAYIHLISCGEILSGLSKGTTKVSEDIEPILREIEKSLNNGRRKANVIRSHVRSLKSKFCDTISDLLSDDFFPYSDQASRPSINRENLDLSIKAAYDLRSLNLHKGAPFGKWVKPGDYQNAEKQLGRPISGSSSLEKAIFNAPTYVGLERLIRFCLYNFALRHGYFRP